MLDINNNTDYRLYMKDFSQLQMQTLDSHLAKVSFCDRPSDGWVRGIRKALGMSVQQLASRIGMKQQSASKLEANELDDSITLGTLRKAAEGLDCRLVYALVPNEGSLEATARKQALKKARALVAPVNHTMVLEAQGVNNIEQKISETADDLMKNITPRLWDK